MVYYLLCFAFAFLLGGVVGFSSDLPPLFFQKPLDIMVLIKAYVCVNKKIFIHSHLLN